jgi:dephospho-CoA kinase
VADVVVAVTGGVASGKSAATRAFEALGRHVADADVAARDLVAPGSAGLAAVVDRFGPGVLGADGALDRRALRERIFREPDAKRALEAILHPRIRAALEAEVRAAPGPYAVVAIPLLAEVGGRAAYPWLDRIVVIDVPREVQHARLVARDGVDAALADAMLDAQASRAQRLAIADEVIDNTGTLEALQAAVAALDARLRAAGPQPAA